MTDYEDKCMDEIFTEKDAQEEFRQRQHDHAVDALALILQECNAEKDYSDKVCVIREIAYTTLKSFGCE